MLFLYEDGIVLGLLSLICLCEDYIFLHDFVLDSCAGEECLQAFLQKSRMFLLVALDDILHRLARIRHIDLDGGVIYEIHTQRLVDDLHLGFESHALLRMGWTHGQKGHSESCCN